MKARIKLYKNDKITDDGYPVKIIISHNRKTRRKTIAHSFEDTWDSSYEFPTPYHPDHKNLYDLIDDIRNKSKTLAFKNIGNFDEAFNYLIQEKESFEKDFYKIAKNRIDYMYSLGRVGNAEAYQESITAFKKMYPTMNVGDITKQKLIEFKEWKKSQGLANSTVRKYLSELRAIYNSGSDIFGYENTKPFIGVFKGLKVRSRAKVGYLLRCCLELLDSLEDVTPAQRRSIDLGMLQFYLGSSFVDVYKLKWEYINKGRVFFPYREKMKDERGAPYDVKIFDCAYEIIHKYKGEDPVYVFPWNKSHDGVKNFRGNMNDDLKAIQKKFNITVHPNNINLTTSVFRKSFGTIGKFSGLSEDILRELMGHERDETRNAYNDVFPEHIRDEAQQKIISL